AKTNPGKLAKPPSVVTAISPLDPSARTASALVLLIRLNEAAGVPPNVMPVNPSRLLPEIVILSPLNPNRGVKEVATGLCRKVNPAKSITPPGVVTDTAPVDPSPITASIFTSDIIEN